MIELQQLALSWSLLFVLIRPGEPLTWYWLLVLPSLALLTIFNVGLALFAARTGAGIDDFASCCRS